MAVLLTSGTSYTVPSNATSMKAWAVGQGAYTSNIYNRKGLGAGGCAYKTWSVTGGSSVIYSVGHATTDNTYWNAGADTTVTYSGSTITGNGAPTSSSGGSFSGGDGGANGGSGRVSGPFGNISYAGAVGGNGASTPCGRTKMTDISGLLAALTLAGAKVSEDCGSAAAFGSGGWHDSKYYYHISSGYGAATMGDSPIMSGAVVLYFT
jgi:hypothetical protein